jgi:soluble lytic murein transglycosylase-like protein
MMVTKGAAKEAGYKYADVKNDPAINIQAGTKYLQIRIDRAGGNLLNGLNGYGTGAGYGNNIIKCEQSLIRNPENPIKALSQIYKQ